ncbi:MULTISPECIES: helix-turn-helix transcriptional regulator [Flavobacterium]|uniref:Plasmid maintenance system antidote protein n=2 Tax=Flavobacterium TaxID=237 RepID=A0A1S1J2J0_9FLAO|nr:MULTISPECIES: helix-turn-helix domain-containing protein [Flavobacterium]MCC9020483.1 helix-turn-helix domain-containing protein [Flavobacterium sp. F-126]MDL2145136.1 helix-turn-helix domain-containing protein [Flavobacterium tructae]OHT43695.1 plasmid maintenance system antidote protein [Flavobacterium tructae]OXB18919.1 plasmid maintenance system antidote protein [Flavobacterium tructae]
MKRDYEKYKGIHPGAVLKRELDKRNISQLSFAHTLSEHAQTINAIVKGKRNLNTALAIKIEEALGVPEGALLVLQVYYDIKKEKEKSAQRRHPELSRLRRGLFWDTNIDAINWEKQSKAVISRVFERGNMSEKKEIVRFYGIEKIKPVLRETAAKPHFTASPNYSKAKRS